MEIDEEILRTARNLLWQASGYTSACDETGFSKQLTYCADSIDNILRPRQETNPTDAENKE